MIPRPEAAPALGWLGGARVPSKATKGRAGLDAAWVVLGLFVWTAGLTR